MGSFQAPDRGGLLGLPPPLSYEESLMEDSSGAAKPLFQNHAFYW